MAQLWELNVGDTFVANVAKPRLAYEVVDIILNHQGRMESCLVTPRARHTAEGWQLLKRGVFHLTADPNARVHVVRE